MTACRPLIHRVPAAKLEARAAQAYADGVLAACKIVAVERERLRRKWPAGNLLRLIDRHLGGATFNQFLCKSLFSRSHFFRGAFAHKTPQNAHAGKRPAPPLGVTRRIQMNFERPSESCCFGGNVPTSFPLLARRVRGAFGADFRCLPPETHGLKGWINSRSQSVVCSFRVARLCHPLRMNAAVPRCMKAC